MARRRRPGCQRVAPPRAKDVGSSLEEEVGSQGPSLFPPVSPLLRGETSHSLRTHGLLLFRLVHGCRVILCAEGAAFGPRGREMAWTTWAKPGAPSGRLVDGAPGSRAEPLWVWRDKRQGQHVESSQGDASWATWRSVWAKVWWHFTLGDQKRWHCSCSQNDQERQQEGCADCDIMANREGEHSRTTVEREALRAPGTAPGEQRLGGAQAQASLA